MAFLLQGSAGLVVLSFLVFATSIAQTTKITDITNSTDCSILSLVLPRKVAFPNDAKYTASLSSYYSAQGQLTKPACIVIPTSANDVSSAIKALAAFYATSPSCATFEIRSGGRAPFAGAVDIAGGVTIDLRNLNTWCLLGQCLRILNPLKLTINGGRGANIGVGGFILGANQVVGFEIVLANGKIVYAQATGHNVDLFIALKSGGFIVYPITEISKLLAAFSNFMTPTNSDPYADIILAVGYTSAGINTVNFDISNITAEIDTNNLPGFCKLYMSISFAHSRSIYAKIYTLFTTSTSQVASVLGINYFLIYHPSPALTGQNILGHNPADKSLVILQLSISYTNATDDNKVAYAAKSFFANEFIYLNYGAPFQDLISGYGAANKAKLQAASKKYDPVGLFQKAAPGGFKLFP
ncbi:hypothetical protein B0O99DRAFT_650999 [Bisporella sp. PMI_857]|nr:hypothetical protein B0O99DRAFT_650999 [Bisporella sp. PMI_857]